MRVHSVHVMNVDRRQAAADPQSKPPDLGCESACMLLSSTTTITIYPARKLILIYRPEVLYVVLNPKSRVPFDVS